LSDLQVTTVQESAAALQSVFNGEKGPKRDIALLNTAAALVVSEKSENLGDAISLASDSIDSGRARATLDALIQCSQ
jgi:anthranilate phosphoribosyltransferase